MTSGIESELQRERAHVERATARLQWLVANAQERVDTALSEPSRHWASLADRDVFVRRGLDRLRALTAG